MNSSWTYLSSAQSASTAETNYGTLSIPILLGSALHDDTHKHTDSPWCRQAQIDLDGRRLSVEVINHIEGPKVPATQQAVAREFHLPALVHTISYHQGLRVSGGNAFLSLSAQVQFQQAVHPINTLVIARMPLGHRILKTLLKS